MALRAHIKSWVWWLLPFLVARALMPVGFMVQPQNGQFQVIMCSALSAPSQNAATVTQLHEVAGSGAAGHASHDHSLDHFSCPFAAAAFAPVPHLHGGGVTTYFPSAEAIPPAQSPHAARGPPRLDRVRGPPVFS